MDSELQAAIDTLTDGDLLREMTSHNAADFANATAVIVKAARKVANLDYEAAAEAVWIDKWNDEDGNPSPWKPRFIKAVVDAALGVSEAPDET